LDVDAHNVPTTARHGPKHVAEQFLESVGNVVITVTPGG
jgi:hypothetical protein